MHWWSSTCNIQNSRRQRRGRIGTIVLLFWQSMAQFVVKSWVLFFFFFTRTDCFLGLHYTRTKLMLGLSDTYVFTVFRMECNKQSWSCSLSTQFLGLEKICPSVWKHTVKRRPVTIFDHPWWQECRNVGSRIVAFYFAFMFKWNSCCGQVWYHCKLIFPKPTPFQDVNLQRTVK